MFTAAGRAGQGGMGSGNRQPQRGGVNLAARGLEDRHWRQCLDTVGTQVASPSIQVTRGCGRHMGSRNGKSRAGSALRSKGIRSQTVAGLLRGSEPNTSVASDHQVGGITGQGPESLGQEQDLGYRSESKE